VNLYDWFANNEGGAIADPQHRATFVTASDLALVRSLGFTHVRLSVGLVHLYTPDDPEMFIDPIFLGDLDRAIDAIHAADLAVTIAPFSDAPLRSRLYADPEEAVRLARFWTRFAAHLAPRDPELLYLEILNEPAVSWAAFEQGLNWDRALEVGADLWQRMQAQLLHAIRQAAPAHTVVLSGDDWGGLDGLERLTPLSDPNVVYSVHLYEPRVFTHQGAYWMTDIVSVRGLEYPTNAANCAAVREAADEAAYEQLDQYCAEDWNEARITTEVVRLATWAERHDAHVWIGEFGAYARYAPAGHAERFVADLRTAIEARGIGWSVWDYTGWADRFVDPKLVQALGLDAPR
jgi:hypothetical protein